MVVASKVISRNVARSQVISQKIILTDRISLLPQVQAEMNIASALPQTEADFFDEKGTSKTIHSSEPTSAYRQYVCIKESSKGTQVVIFSFQTMVSKSSIILLLQFQIQILLQSLSPDFPFQEFPLTEVVNQSQIDYYSISDTSDPRECSNSTKKAPTSTDFSLKSVQNCSSDEEMAFLQRSHRIYSSYTIFQRF